MPIGAHLQRAKSDKSSASDTIDVEFQSVDASGNGDVPIAVKTGDAATAMQKAAPEQTVAADEADFDAENAAKIEEERKALAAAVQRVRIGTQDLVGLP